MQSLSQESCSNVSCLLCSTCPLDLHVTVENRVFSAQWEILLLAFFFFQVEISRSERYFYNKYMYEI